MCNMKNIIKIIAFCIAFCISSSCTTTKTLLYSTDRNLCVPIVFSNTEPNFEYDKLGYIEVSRSIFASNDKLLYELSEKAKEKGFDAVIDVDFFYIPHFFAGIPAVRGIGVKMK